MILLKYSKDLAARFKLILKMYVLLIAFQGIWKAVVND